ncbi:MAG: DUF4268 domain-containing protein [Candidatus Hodarchaeales archaeon]|jgi:hypothetical protein
MLFPIKQLIEGQGTPLCVRKDTNIKDALAYMMENDYSQLPVIDNDSYLIGIITEQSIISTYFHTSGVVSLLDISVDHCLTTPATISPERDIFDALDLLKNADSIVVVRDKKPVGIVTDYDTTQFFQNISGGLILVEDIEVTLRQYITNLIKDEETLKTALYKAFGHDKQKPTEPAQQYEELSLGGYIKLILNSHNWPIFEPFFKPRELFFELLDQVRQIRNQLSHFRGRLEPIQHDALVRARDWLSSRPKVPVTLEIHVIEHIHVTDTIELSIADDYLPFRDWLLKLRNQKSRLRITIDEIENIKGEELPASARKHISWWDNDYQVNPHALSWLKAGFRVNEVDLSTEEIFFQQSNHVLMQLFFAEALETFKTIRPGQTSAKKTFPQNWWSFGAGKSGFNFGWVFTGHSTLRVELYIDTGDRVKNKSGFDTLEIQKDAIENELGYELNWERLNKKRASRISVEKPYLITDPEDTLEEAKQWMVTTTLQFVDVFQRRLKELRVE